MAREHSRRRGTRLVGDAHKDRDRTCPRTDAHSHQSSPRPRPYIPRLAGRYPTGETLTVFMTLCVRPGYSHPDDGGNQPAGEGRGGV